METDFPNMDKRGTTSRIEENTDMPNSEERE